MQPKDIAYWLGRIGYVPSTRELQRHTGCSLATAYRWRAFAQDAEDLNGGLP